MLPYEVKDRKINRLKFTLSVFAMSNMAFRLVKGGLLLFDLPSFASQNMA